VWARRRDAPGVHRAPAGSRRRRAARHAAGGRNVRSGQACAARGRPWRRPGRACPRRAG